MITTGTKNSCWFGTVWRIRGGGDRMECSGIIRKERKNSGYAKRKMDAVHTRRAGRYELVFLLLAISHGLRVETMRGTTHLSQEEQFSLRDE